MPVKHVAKECNHIDRHQWNIEGAPEGKQQPAWYGASQPSKKDIFLWVAQGLHCPYGSKTIDQKQADGQRQPPAYIAIRQHYTHPFIRNSAHIHI